MNEELTNPVIGDEEETSTDSSSEQETVIDEPSQEGDNTPKQTPYHKDARWIEMYEKAKRVDDLERKLNELQTAQQELKNSNSEPEKMPKWFFGDEDAWKEYQESNKSERERMKAEILNDIRQAEKAEIEAEEQEVEDFKDYFDSEVASLKEDFSFDENALKDYVIENEITDSRGVYDLKRGLMKMMAGNVKPASNPARKKIAGMASQDSSVEPQKKEYATPDDFIGGNRPW